MSELAEHPVVEMENVEPIFVRSMLIGAMTVRYLRAVPGLGYEAAHESAMATWDTDWPDDPAPRTFEGAVEVVDEDLAYWTDD